MMNFFQTLQVVCLFSFVREINIRLCYYEILIFSWSYLLRLQHRVDLVNFFFTLCHNVKIAENSSLHFDKNFVKPTVLLELISQNFFQWERIFTENSLKWWLASNTNIKHENLLLVLIYVCHFHHHFLLLTVNQIVDFLSISYHFTYFSHTFLSFLIIFQLFCTFFQYFR